MPGFGRLPTNLLQPMVLAFVMGAITASASFIDAPAACRAALPEANPGLYLTSALGITLPFNRLIGIPLYYRFATWL